MGRDGGEVVLGVDPLGDNERRGQDRLQHEAVRVVVVLVGVQERAALQVDAAGPGTWSDDEGGVAGQAPFGIDPGPVGGAGAGVAVRPRRPREAIPRSMGQQIAPLGSQQLTRRSEVARDLARLVGPLPELLDAEDRADEEEKADAEQGLAERGVTGRRQPAWKGTRGLPKQREGTCARFL